MRISRNWFRMLYSVLVVAAFFIPAYREVSAFGFLGLAIGSVQTDTEITIIDVLVVLLPLLFVPISALFILYRAFRQRPSSGLVLSLPLFFLFFFFLILSFDMSRQVNDMATLKLMEEMNPGFYLAALASVLLLFSYSKREALNLDADTE